LINFRFHLISLIAVFLALALGVVMGYGVLGQPTVDTLQNRVDDVEARANKIKTENGELRADNGRLSDALAAVGDFAVTSRLDNATIVPVAVRGVDEDHVTDSVRLARNGGATVPGVVWLEEKWGLTDEDDVAELATIVGTQATSRAGVRDAAARALATRLASGPATGSRADLLTELADAKFLSLQTVPDPSGVGEQFEASTFDGRGARHLLVGGTEAAVPAARSTVLLARTLVLYSLGVVVADDWRKVEGGPERGADLAGVLEDLQLVTAAGTVDNFDDVDGPLTAVLALAERGQGIVGHYGRGAGADRPMPEWWTV
jgi:hypothetical protein